MKRTKALASIMLALGLAFTPLANINNIINSDAQVVNIGASQKLYPLTTIYFTLEDIEGNGINKQSRDELRLVKGKEYKIKARLESDWIDLIRFKPYIFFNGKFSAHMPYFRNVAKRENISQYFSFVAGETGEFSSEGKYQDTVRISGNRQVGVDFNTEKYWEINLSRLLEYTLALEVKYYDEQGNLLTTKEVDYKKTAENLKYEKSDYELTWVKKGTTEKYDFNTEVTDHLELQQLWTKKDSNPPVVQDEKMNIYNVDFIYNGVTPKQEIKNQTVSNKELYTLPKLEPLKSKDEKYQYKFLGWKISNSGETLQAESKINVNKNIILYAQWDKKEIVKPIEMEEIAPLKIFNISYLYGDVTPKNTIENTTRVEKEKYVIPNLEPLNSQDDSFEYKFLYWTDENANKYYADDEITVNSNLTLTAVWQKLPIKKLSEEYYVSFDYNGKEVVDPIPSHGAYKNGDSVYLPEVNSVDNNYLLSAWRNKITNEDYAVKTSLNINNADINLLAVWTTTSDTLIVNPNVTPSPMPEIPSNPTPLPDDEKPKNDNNEQPKEENNTPSTPLTKKTDDTITNSPTPEKPNNNTPNNNTRTPKTSSITQTNENDLENDEKPTIPSLPYIKNDTNDNEVSLNEEPVPLATPEIVEDDNTLSDKPEIVEEDEKTPLATPEKNDANDKNLDDVLLEENKTPLSLPKTGTENNSTLIGGLLLSIGLLVKRKNK